MSKTNRERWSIMFAGVERGTKILGTGLSGGAGAATQRPAARRRPTTSKRMLSRRCVAPGRWELNEAEFIWRFRASGQAVQARTTSWIYLRQLKMKIISA